jgi:PD-(D/E)XK nuclease superfamily
MKTPQLRTSERTSFKRCPQQWWWSYRMGLKPKGPEKTALWFGTGVHLGLAEWYLPGTKRGVHPAETFEAYAGESLHTIKTAAATDETVAEYEDGKTLGVTLLDEYVKHYGTDEHWNFIQAEQRFALPIPWPKMKEERQLIFEVEDGAVIVEYVGTYDGVYLDLRTDRLELLETKTAAAIQTSHLSLDDQAGSYYATASHALRAAKLIPPNAILAGINYNFLRKAMPDERPRDAEGYYTNKPVKADYIAAINAERMKMPAKGPAGSWLGPEPTGKETLALLEQIAQKMELTVLGERSKVQPKPLFERHYINRTKAEQKAQLRRIQDEAVQMEIYRQGLLPIVKRPQRDCAYMCEHHAVCELQERGGNWQDLQRVSMKVQDPYADHRKSASE